MDLYKHVLTGLLSVVLLSSAEWGYDDYDSGGKQYTHHFKKDFWGDFVVVPEKYREYMPDNKSFIVWECSTALIFDCLSNSCKWPEEERCSCGR